MNDFGVFLFPIIWFIEPHQCLQQNENVVIARPKDTNSRSYGLAFVFGGMFLGTTSQILLKKLKLPFCYPSLVIPIGMLLGYLGTMFEPLDLYFGLTRVHCAYINTLCLPVLVYRLAFCVDVHAFVRSQLQIVTIAGPVMVLTGFCTGIVMWLMIDPSWDVDEALLFGILCTPTYAIVVAQFLKERGVKTKQSEILMEGESMLGMATTTIVVCMLRHGITHDYEKWYDGIVCLLLFVGVAIVVGLAVGHCGRICMRKIHDFATLTIVTLVIPILTYYSCSFAMIGSTSGIIAVLVVGVIMSSERTSLPEEVDCYVTKLWDFLSQVVETLVFLISSVHFSMTIVRDMEAKDYVLILVTYFISTLSRFACFFVFAPVLSRFNYGMTFSQMLFLVWGGLKSSVNLLLAMDIYRWIDRYEIARVIFMHVFGIILLNFMINYTTIPLLFRVIGWSEISLARETNMNNCVKHLRLARKRSIAILKMDRFLVDANWPMVLFATNFKHPYKLMRKDDRQKSDGRDGLSTGYRYGYCADCKKEVLNEPTAKELKEMMREARMRILKAQKMSFVRQFERGMLTLRGMRILSQAIDMATDTRQAVLELDGLFLLFQKRGYSYFVHSYVVFVVQRYINVPQPSKGCRRICYNTVTKKSFIIFINIMVMLSMIPIILDLIYTVSLYSDFGLTLLIFNTIFNSIFVGEFVMKILAYSQNYHNCKYGFRTYFKSGWNILDFTLVSFYTIDLTYQYIALAILEESESARKTADEALRLVRLVRFLKLLSLWELFAPKIVVFLNSTIDKRLSFAYDLGKGFVSAQEQVLEMLPYMIDHATIKEEMRSQLESDRLAVTRELGIVQKDRPWIAITVKTKQAMTTVLNHIKDSINELKVSGWADDVEFNKLSDSLRECFKYVKSIKYIQPSSPMVIFKEVAWLEGDREATEFLYDKVATKKFDPGDFVCREGDVSEGIFVVVTGLLVTKYVPQPEILHDMQLYGCLPIVDYLSSDAFDAALDDYIVSGNTFGELSTLTGRPYNSTITAETHCQVYVLSRENVKAAMRMSPDPINGLECRLWKSVSIRLATAILIDVPAYQGATQDKIRFTLERSFIPNISIYKSFVVNDMMIDIILIEGIVVDDHSKFAFRAPTYIPRTVKKLLLPGHPDFKVGTTANTKLLIIPVKDADEYEVMSEANQQAELMSIDSGSSVCLQHLIRYRPASFKRKAKYLRPLRKTYASASNVAKNQTQNLPKQSPASNESKTSGLTAPSSEIEMKNIYMTPHGSNNYSNEDSTEDKSSRKPK